jgi:hypothetical protein
MHLQLGTSYLPGRVYLRELMSADSVHICGGTPWQKQTLRNRTFILSPNGIQRLIVPVQHTGGITFRDSEIKIDYSLPWIREHKGALEAAYNTSPYFEFLKDELFAIFDAQPNLLFEMNFQILRLLLRKLKSTTELVKAPVEAAELPLLSTINCKNFPDDAELPSYPQVFGYKFGFINRLSSLDELCNTGR